MRKRAFVIAAITISSIIFLLGFWQTVFSTRWSAPQAATDVIGSPFISKQGNAGDKVIVIAKMASENVDWVTDGLPE